MRYPIMMKDDAFTVAGMRINVDPAVVELPEMATIWWNYDFGDLSGPYGTITDLRVEGEEITGEVRIYDPTWDENTMDIINCRLAGYYNKVEYKTDLDGGNPVVTSCILRAVSVIMNPPYGANPFPKGS